MVFQGFWDFRHSQRASNASVSSTSRKSQSPRKRNHVWKFTKSQKTFSTPQNFTKSQKSPEHPFPHLQSLCELYLSVSFFSLCGLPLSELYLSVSRDLHCSPKTWKNQWFFKVFEVSGLSRELQESRRPHQKHLKNNCFFMLLGFQAFLESFQCQECLIKNIKNLIVFSIFGDFRRV